MRLFFCIFTFTISLSQLLIPQEIGSLGYGYFQSYSNNQSLNSHVLSYIDGSTMNYFSLTEINRSALDIYNESLHTGL